MSSVVPVLLATAAMAAATVGLARRRAPGWLPFTLLAVVVEAWVLMALLDAPAAPAMGGQADRLRLVAAALAPALWLWFALRHRGREVPVPAAMGLLVPAAALALVFVIHGLGSGGMAVAGEAIAWLAGVLVTTAAAVLVRRREGVDPGERGPLMWLAGAGAFPWLVAALPVLGVPAGPGYDPMPVALALAALVAAVALERQWMERRGPMAYREAFTDLSDGILLVEERGIVLDINPAAERALGLTRAGVLRRPLSGLRPDLAALGRDPIDLRPAEDDGAPVFEVRAHRLSTGRGSMVVIRDVTGARAAEEALLRRAAVLAALERSSRDFTGGAGLGDVLDRLLAELGSAVDASRVVLLALPAGSGVRPDQPRGRSRPTVVRRWENLEAGPWPSGNPPYSQALLANAVEPPGFAGELAELPAADRNLLEDLGVGYAVVMPVRPAAGESHVLAFEWPAPPALWLPLVVDALRAAPAALEAAFDAERAARQARTAHGVRAALLELTRELLQGEDSPAFFARLLELAVTGIPGARSATLWLRREDGTFERAAALGRGNETGARVDEAGLRAGEDSDPTRVVVLYPADGVMRGVGEERGEVQTGPLPREGTPPEVREPTLAVPVWLDGRLEASLRIGGDDAVADATELAEAFGAQLGAWVQRMRRERRREAAARLDGLLAETERLLLVNDRVAGSFPLLARLVLAHAELSADHMVVLRAVGTPRFETYDAAGQRQPELEAWLATAGADAPDGGLEGVLAPDGGPWFQREGPGGLPAAAWSAVPLRLRDRSWGVLALLHREPVPGPTMVLGALERIGGGIELALLRQDDRERLEGQLARLDAMVRTSEALRSVTRRRDAVLRSLDAVLEMIAADACTLLLFDAERDALRAVASRGRGARASALGAEVPRDASAPWRVFAGGGPVIEQPPAAGPSAPGEAPGAGPAGFLGAPLRNGEGTVVGVLAATIKAPGRTFGEADAGMLEAIALACGAALDRLALLDRTAGRADRYRESYDGAERLTHELQLLERIRALTATELDLDRLYGATARAMARVLGYGSVELYGVAGEELTLLHRAAADGLPPVGGPRPPGEAALRSATEAGHAVLLSERSEVDGVTGGAEVIAPVRVRGVTTALLRVGGGGQALDDDDRRVVGAAAEQLGAAAERAELHGVVKRSEERFRLLAEHMSDVVCLHHADGRFRYISPSALAVLGYRPDELVGRDPFELNHDEDRERVREGPFRRLLEGATALRYSVRFRHREGHYVWLETIASAVVGPDGTVEALVTASRDVGERKRMEERLLHGALFDGLTGLPNRALLFDRLEHALARAARDDSARFAVLFLDLDRFKVVNDSLGHHAGDELLKALAARLRACVRGSDTVARLGGDEFCILLEDAWRDDATVTATRIQRSLADAFHLGDHDIFTSASIGIAFSAPHYREPQELLRDADIAMYSAKADGKARYAVFDEGMHAQVFSQMELESSLHRAVEREELFLEYQPVVDLASGRILGVEALVRWRHPTQGLVPPASFVPLAEETGLIVSIDRWVLRNALAQLERWDQQDPEAPPLFLSVNVSARHLSLGDVEALLGEGAEHRAVPAGRLKLEISESALMGNPLSAGEVLVELRQRGVLVQVDDFGTGYSSLSYLNRLPIDSLKIDRSFVQRLDQDRTNHAIVSTILRLADALGIGVVAEGVERPEEAAALVALGCRQGQGFLFHGPLPGDAVPGARLDPVRG